MADVITVNGVPLGAGAADPNANTKTITLPSGKTATIRKGKGKDLMRVQTRLMGRAKELGDDGFATTLIFHLMSELTQVDGKMLPVEDLEEMDLSDVLAIQGEVIGKNFFGSSAGDLAVLVEWGISPAELKEMEFAEIGFWVRAIAKVEVERAKAIKEAAGKE